MVFLRSEEPVLRRLHSKSACVALAAAFFLALATTTDANTAAAAPDAAASAADSSPAAAKLPAVQVSPKKVNFGKLAAGITSAPAIVTFTNKSAGSLAAPSVAVTGTGFQLNSNGCTGPIAAGSSCPVSAVFKPPSVGKFKAGLLTFTDGAAKSPQKVKLSGIGLPGVPTPTPTPTRTPTATPTPVFNKVFVTSTTFDGNLGGQANADSECATLAGNAGLAGTFKAWLSTSILNAKDKLGSARGFIRTDGEPFADQVSDITAGKILNPIILDESGATFDFNDVRTGTSGSGTATASTCMDFTSISMDAGEFGRTSAGAAEWTDVGTTSCDQLFQLYCFDTSHTTTLTVTKTSGRIAFVSKGDFDTATGVTGADTLCANEASAASRSGTFKALLSTTTVAATTHTGFDFSIGSAPYVRPDGIKIADAQTIAAGGPLNSGIWQNADGTYQISRKVWTGSTTPSSVGSDETCIDWTTNSSSSSGKLGDSYETQLWFTDGSSPCDGSFSVYCLQQ